MARARSAYEHGRLRHALHIAAPTLLIAAVAAILNRAIVWAAAGGSLLFAVVVFLCWRGRDVERGVKLGVLAGLLPFAAITLAHLAVPHACMGGRCYAVCLPTCALSGLVAGTVVGFAVARLEQRLWAWIAAGVGIALTGALACPFLGIMGVLGIGVGVIASSVLLVAQSAMKRRRAP